MLCSRLTRIVTTAMAAVLLGAACGSSTPGTEAFCSGIRDLDQLGITLTGDATVLADASADVADLAEVAPIEVRPSVEVLAGALDRMSQAVTEAGGDPSAALDAALSALTPMIDDVDQASAAVESYAKQNCNFSLLDTGSSEPS